MDIVINDTNIFLDLYAVDLLDTFFQLPIHVHTVDFVVDEIKQPEQRTVIQQLIAKGLLKVIGYSSEHLVNLYQIAQITKNRINFTSPLG